VWHLARSVPTCQNTESVLPLSEHQGEFIVLVWMVYINPKYINKNSINNTPCLYNNSPQRIFTFKVFLLRNTSLWNIPLSVYSSSLISPNYINNYLFSDFQDTVASGWPVTNIILQYATFNLTTNKIVMIMWEQNKYH
jgi:hypothetical protein